MQGDFQILRIINNNVPIYRDSEIIYYFCIRTQKVSLSTEINNKTITT